MFEASEKHVGKDGSSNEPTARAAVWVGLLLSFALICLVHDTGYATAFGADAAEAGRFVEQQAQFQSDLSSARWGRKLGFATLLLTGVYCAATTPRDRRWQGTVLSLLIVAGLVWTLASIGWSMRPHHTGRELVRLFGYMFVAAALAWKFEPRSLCVTLMVAIGACLATAVCFEAVTGGLRPWVSNYRLTGSMHSGAVGAYSMLLTVATYAMARQRQGRIYWFAFVAAVGILLLSKALTSFVAASVGIAAFHVFGQSKRSLVLGTCLAATLLAVALIATSTTSFWGSFRAGRVEAFGRDYDFSSFNGRVPLWNALWKELQGRRLQGFGYGAFWSVDQIEAFNDDLKWYASHAHSAYLGTIVHVGLVGLALLLSVGMLAMHFLIRRARAIGSPEDYVFASCLVAVAVISIAETVFVEPRDLALVGAAIVLSCTVLHEPAGANVRTRSSHAMVLNEKCFAASRRSEGGLT